MLEQLTLDLGDPTLTAPRRRQTPILERPLTPAQRREVERLCRRHWPLCKRLYTQLRPRFMQLDPDEVFSCCSTALLKTAITFDPARGFQFSTLFRSIAEGELKHHLRDHHWLISAPTSVREKGLRARRLIEAGNSLIEVQTELGLDRAGLHDVLLSVAPYINGFDQDRDPDD
jgi:DNA-directed RNA polymerase specialized sigma subunit